MNIYNFILNTKYMLSGMITIFVVIGIIVLMTMLINKFSNYLSSKNEQQ